MANNIKVWAKGKGDEKKAHFNRLAIL